MSVPNQFGKKNLSVSIDGRPVADLKDGNLHYLNTTGG
jgi:hypothetical protein